jgi:DNA-binding HxlR family transcriptional regulator
MQHARFADAECPIARSLDGIGEWWSLLILRDALDGATRFDQFARNLGISPATLTRRLRALVADGLLTTRRYQDHPPRDEYVPTARGRSLLPVLVALQVWGERDREPDEHVLQLVDAASGAVLDPVLVDRTSGRPLSEIDAVFRAGPAASTDMRERFDELQHQPR